MRHSALSSWVQTTVTLIRSMGPPSRHSRATSACRSSGRAASPISDSRLRPEPRRRENALRLGGGALVQPARQCRVECCERILSGETSLRLPHPGAYGLTRGALDRLQRRDRRGQILVFERGFRGAKCALRAGLVRVGIAGLADHDLLKLVHDAPRRIRTCALGRFVPADVPGDEAEAVNQGRKARDSPRRALVKGSESRESLRSLLGQALPRLA